MVRLGRGEELFIESSLLCIAKHQRSACEGGPGGGPIMIGREDFPLACIPEEDAARYRKRGAIRCGLTGVLLALLIFSFV